MNVRERVTAVSPSTVMGKVGHPPRTGSDRRTGHLPRPGRLGMCALMYTKRGTPAAAASLMAVTLAVPFSCTGNTVQHARGLIACKPKKGEETGYRGSALARCSSISHRGLISRSARQKVGTLQLTLSISSCVPKAPMVEITATAPCKRKQNPDDETPPSVQTALSTPDGRLSSLC